MANGLKKSKDEIIQDNLEISEEVLAEIPKAKAPKDEYVIPEIKEKDKRQDPGHSSRDFRK